MKYRKKPTIIDAVQWDGNNQREMFEFLGGSEVEFMKAQGKNFYISHSRIEGGLVIITLEGDMNASIGDWIIKGIQGEYYPCKPDIFKETYEEVMVTTT